MAPTDRVVRQELDNLLAYLINSEIALHANPVMDEQGRVSWRSFYPRSRFLDSCDPPSFVEYREWVISGAYSALLYDGALLQITYDFAGHELLAHRLAWVPCPFIVDEDLLQTEPLVEVIDMYAAGGPAEVALRTAVRFDFDLESATRGHPAAGTACRAGGSRFLCPAIARQHSCRHCDRRSGPGAQRRL